MAAINSSLVPRSALGWLRERDIDLLLCSELHADGELARYLGEQIASTHARFGGAWVSHVDADGESDLVVEYDAGDERVVALVENKVAAAFQPEQAERYAARCERWRAAAPGTRVVSVLFAPEEYMSRSGAEKFDYRVSYESAERVLRMEGDRRSIFFAEALIAAVESYRAGYVMVPNESATSTWLECWKMVQSVAPKLNLQPPGAKPVRSQWIYFYDAEGFSKADRKLVIVAYKAGHGYADLQFQRTSSAELERRAKGLLESDMRVTQAGKSASIRIAVPKVDFMRSAAEQQSEMSRGLEASERLRALFVRHRDRLLGL